MMEPKHNGIFSERQSRILLNLFRTYYAGSNAEFCSLYHVDNANFAKLQNGSKAYEKGVDAILEWAELQRLPEAVEIRDELAKAEEPGWKEDHAIIRSICLSRMEDRNSFCSKFEVSQVALSHWLDENTPDKEIFEKACYWVYTNPEALKSLPEFVLCYIEPYIVEKVGKYILETAEQVNDKNFIESLDSKRLRCLFMLTANESLAHITLTLGIERDQLLKWLKGGVAYRMSATVIPYLQRAFTYQTLSMAMCKVETIMALENNYNPCMRIRGVPFGEIADKIFEYASIWSDYKHGIDAVSLALEVHVNMGTLGAILSKLTKTGYIPRDLEESAGYPEEARHMESYEVAIILSSLLRRQRISHNAFCKMYGIYATKFSKWMKGKRNVPECVRAAKDWIANNSNI